MIANFALRSVGLALLMVVGGCAVGPLAVPRIPSVPVADARPAAAPVIEDMLDVGAARSGASINETADPSVTGQAVGDGPIALRARLSRVGADMSAPRRVLVRIDYAATAKVPVERPRLHIALVIDRSGSMAEDRKLQYTLAAARWVIDNLSDEDMLSIVAFGDQATVLSAAGRAVNKPFLLHRLDEITPAGSTNLSAGLLEGIAQVGGTDSSGRVRQVLLLTDGLANRGETNAAKLRQIAEQARSQGVGVSTMGVGTEFNEAVLMAIAVAGGGRYTYVKTAEQIPSAFKDELHGLLPSVAQNMTIELGVSGGAIGKVYGQLLDQPVRAYKLAIGDLRATESGLLLAELERSALGGVERMEVDVRLVFDDPQAGGRISRVVRLRSPDEGELAEDQRVLLVAAILDGLERAEVALQGLDAERFSQAKVLFAGLHERAREYAVRTRDQQLLNQGFALKHFMAELVVAEREGLLHKHREARNKLTKESHYLRYLLTHHRSQP